jgi:HD-GYP domain-containing protein (c-di-GMP phosphodiesterase class II)
MSEQRQIPGQEEQRVEGEQQEANDLPLYEAREPSPAARRVNTLFDDMESKQIENVNESAKALIERIATFLGVLFGLSVLSNNFPPSYLKGNTPIKVLLIAALVCYLLAIGTALWATQVRYYRRYTFNASRSQAEMARIVSRKLGWLRAAQVLFALGTVALAVMLIVIVWNT